MKKKLGIIISLFSLTVNAQSLLTEKGSVYDLKLDKSNELQSQLHDYLNNVLMICQQEPLDKEYWRNGVFGFRNYGNTEPFCKSLKENAINLTCNDFDSMLLSTAKRPRALPTIYPTVKKSDLNKTIELRSNINCYINETFKENREAMKLYVTYDFKVENPKFEIMNLRGKKYEILNNNIKLIPNIKELKKRSEIIVVVED